MKLQKCPKCKTWNQNATRCEQCGTALVADELNKEYREKIEQEDANKEESKVFKYFQSMRTSKYLAVRITYSILFSLWSVYMFFVAVFTWIIATTVG
ncbi:MAG: class I tRNA ligase family protein [Flavobacteriales bacterium]|nr:class I tRNA ligase family protein [Flavobacteriales bacterium]